jgi:hypothetical protein
MVVSIWLTLLECRNQGKSEECILALGDNTSAIAWLFRAPKLPPSSYYYTSTQIICRRLAHLMTESGNCLFGQHLKGSYNFVADWLSFAGHHRDHDKPHPFAADEPPNDILTQRFHTYCPQLIPRTFSISPLPSEVSSFVEQVVQTMELSFMESRKLQMPEKTDPQSGGNNSAPQLALSTIGSMTYPHQNKNWSPNPSSITTAGLNLISQDALLADVRTRWLNRHFELPQAIWQRRSGVTTGRVPSTSRTATTSFHLSNDS